MDGLTLTKTVRILDSRLRGKTVNRFSITEDSLYLQIYDKSIKALRIKLSGGTPAFNISEKAQGQIVNKLDMVKGCVIKEIIPRKFDRLFFIKLVKRRPSGKLAEYTLACELMGKMSNAVFIDEDKKVIHMINNNNADADRDFRLGATYSQPKLNKQYTLENTGSVKKFIDLLGFYGVTAEHAENIAKEAGSFEQGVSVILEDLNNEEFYLDERERLVPFRPLRCEHSISIEEVENKLGKAKTVNEELARLKKSLSDYFRKQAKKYKNLTKKLEKEYSEALKWKEYQDKGQLLKDNLYLLKNAKEGEIVLNRYDENGVEEIKYEISKGFDAAVEINKLFKKADKLERSVKKIEDRKDEVEQMADSAEEQMFMVEESESAEELMLLKKEISAPEGRKGKQIKEKQFHKFKIGDFTAYVGKNSVSNHRLVFQFAASGDMWMHAQKIPSGHLILRGEFEPDEDVILIAARVIAAFSKQKNELKVTVDYTRKKHVKKPKNTPPGFVIYHRFKSVDVRPMSEEELEDLRIS